MKLESPLLTRLQALRCLAIPFIMTVAGQDFTNTQPPLLVAHTNGSTHWAVQTIPGLPANGRFLSTSCAGGGSTTTCIAVGQNFGNNQPPLLVVSTNGGKSWAMPTIHGTLPPRFFFSNATCTDSRGTALCLATGHNPTLNTPLLVTSIDGGINWVIPTIPVLSGFFFSSTSCTGSGRNTICVVVGTYQDDSQPPRILVSTDGLHYVAMQPLPELPPEGFLTSTSCTGSGRSAICTAVGKDITNHRPLVIVSTDGTHHWNIQAISGLPVDGFLMSTSCTGSGRRAVCIAVGKDTTNHRPLLAVSNDGGDHWFFQTILGLSADGILNSASCIGDGNTAICIAAGENLETYTPLLITSTNGGKNWRIETVLRSQIKGSFFHAKCTTSNHNAICIAAGENFTTGTPLLVQSTAALTRFITPSIVNLPLAGAFY